MLSEEEKKAIDRLKYALIYDRESISSLMGFNDIKIVLQLVNKQQKEIEKLEKNKKLFLNYEKRVNELEREIAINSISKDKIREKLKELQAMSISGDIYYTDIEKIFYELLEE